MTLLSVETAPIVIGLVLLAAVAAVVVGYVVHMRVLRAQVDRALRERSMRYAASCPSSEPDTRPAPTPARSFGLAFGLPKAAGLSLVAAASQRHFASADDPELRTVAGGGR